MLLAAMWVVLATKHIPQVQHLPSYLIVERRSSGKDYGMCGTRMMSTINGATVKDNHHVKSFERGVYLHRWFYIPLHLPAFRTLP